MEIGDLVLHPRYGVGIIDGIETRVQDGQERAFYVIPKPALSSTIFVPVDSADEVGLRPVASPETLKKALAILSGEEDDNIKTTGLRDLAWNDPIALARAIRRHMTEPKSRYPKVSEQHQLKRAKKLLEEELAVVLGLDEETIAAIMNGERVPDISTASQSA
ncbi:MAG: CarD family transcriptional regulator [Armatimonadota bacterium]|nr:CarD family transcriptional regulator [Armatimonadota bacterium]